MLVWFAMLSIGLGIPLTLVLAPLVSRAILMRVRTSMQQASTAGSGGSAPAAPTSAIRSPNAAQNTQRVSAASILSMSSQQQDLLALTKQKRHRVALAYGAGGVLHALALIVMLLYSLHEKGINVGFTTVTAIALLFALPTLATVATVVSGQLRAGVWWGAGGLLMLLLVAGPVNAALWSIFSLHLLVPVVLFVVFNLRYWRAVAALLLVLVLTGVLGWLAFMQIGKGLVGDMPAMWLFRIGGAVLGVGLALPCARFIGQQYRARRIGEQELAIDTWFALYTYIQFALFIALNAQAGVYIAGTISAFVGYWMIKRVLLRGVRDTDAVPRRLLMLRVFGQYERAERLLDQLTLRWRPLGSVALIAGPDLALRAIDAQDVYTFLTGGLAREFVQDEADLLRRSPQETF